MVEKLLPVATWTSKYSPADANVGWAAGSDAYWDTVSDPWPTALTLVPALLALAVPFDAVELALAELTAVVGAGGGFGAAVSTV
jgi:hypothetical protein